MVKIIAEKLTECFRDVRSAARFAEAYSITGRLVKTTGLIVTEEKIIINGKIINKE